MIVEIVQNFLFILLSWWHMQQPSNAGQNIQNGGKNIMPPTPKFEVTDLPTIGGTGLTTLPFV
jgi:hypothetical protein